MKHGRRDSICILFPFKEGPWGGGNQFLKALRGELERRDLSEPDPARAGVVLVAQWQGLLRAATLRVRDPHKPIVHRVDGPVALIRGGDQEYDDIIYRFNALAANGTIFQSDWSREANLNAGMTPARQTTIVNAPDPHIFSRDGKRPFEPSRRTRLVATSWSGNPRKGFDLYSWLDANLDFDRYEMSFIGNSPVRFRNIRSVPPLDSAALAAELKEHDIYLTGSRFDPCSNSLLEALHCGLPAVAIRHGGHPELIKSGGETFEQFSEVPALLDRIVESYADYQRRIDVRPFSQVVDDYVEFMWSVRDAHLPIPRKAAARILATGLVARAIDNRYGRSLIRRIYARRAAGAR